MPQWDLTSAETDSHGNSVSVVTINSYTDDAPNKAIRIFFHVGDGASAEGSDKSHLVWDKPDHVPTIGDTVVGDNDYTDWMEGSPDLNDDEVLLQKLADDGVIGDGSYIA